MPSAFMQQAIDLAIDSVAEGGGPFGAVVVRDLVVIGRGSNRVVASCDPTAHAEVQAIRDACRRLETHDLTGAQIYSSCEPCPMCLAAIRWSRLSTLYFGCTRQDAAQVGFDDELLHRDFRRELSEWDLIVHPIGRAEALAAFEAWEAKGDRTPY